MRRLIVRHIATGLGVMALLAMLVPRTAQATTYRVKYLARVCSSVTHRCHYVYRYRYVTLSRGTPKGVLSYKPVYNVMSVGTSRRGVAPTGATAVCADGHYVYTLAATTACAAHHGVAWWFVKH